MPSKFRNYWAGKRSIGLNAAYLVKGLLHPGAMSVEYDGSGSGKAFRAAYLGLCVGAEREWRGKRVRQGTVVHIASEGGSLFNNRIAARREDMEIGGDVPFLVVPEVVNLLDPTADLDDLIALVHIAGDVRGEVVLIVVDTLSRAMGGGNENGPDDKTAFAAAQGGDALLSRILLARLALWFRTELTPPIRISIDQTCL